jgi:hypothetical protein
MGITDEISYMIPPLRRDQTELGLPLEGKLSPEATDEVA